MSDLENFLTECERKSLAHSRKQSDIYFDELESLEDELEQTKKAHRRHSDIIHELLLAATQRREKHLADVESGLFDVEAGLADLTGGVGK